MLGNGADELPSCCIDEQMKLVASRRIEASHMVKNDVLPGGS